MKIEQIKNHLFPFINRLRGEVSIILEHTLLNFYLSIIALRDLIKKKTSFALKLVYNFFLSAISPSLFYKIIS